MFESMFVVLYKSFETPLLSPLACFTVRCRQQYAYSNPGSCFLIRLLPVFLFHDGREGSSPWALGSRGDFAFFRRGYSKNGDLPLSLRPSAFSM